MRRLVQRQQRLGPYLTVHQQVVPALEPPYRPPCPVVVEAVDPDVQQSLDTGNGVIAVPQPQDAVAVSAP
jgi:hypothetical protein